MYQIKTFVLPSEYSMKKTHKLKYEFKQRFDCICPVVKLTSRVSGSGLGRFLLVIPAPFTLR